MEGTMLKKVRCSRIKAGYRVAELGDSAGDGWWRVTALRRLYGGTLLLLLRDDQGNTTSIKVDESDLVLQELPT